MEELKIGKSSDKSRRGRVSRTVTLGRQAEDLFFLLESPCFG